MPCRPGARAPPVRSYVDQGGGKRKGAFAIYMEPWHADVFDFLDLRKNHGKEEARARDLFYGLWIPDLFMRVGMTHSHTAPPRVSAQPQALAVGTAISGGTGRGAQLAAGAGAWRLTRPLPARPAARGGGQGVEPVLPQRGARPGGLLGPRLRGAVRALRARGPAEARGARAAAVVRHPGGAGGDGQPVHAVQRRGQQQVQPAEPGHHQVLQPVHRDPRVHQVRPGESAGLWRPVARAVPGARAAARGWEGSWSQSYTAEAPRVVCLCLRLARAAHVWLCSAPRCASCAARSADETAVCNLASIALPRFVRERERDASLAGWEGRSKPVGSLDAANRFFDFDKLADMTKARHACAARLLAQRRLLLTSASRSLSRASRGSGGARGADAVRRPRCGSSHPQPRR
jgi:hypothetical protein